jgi:hypothetical protein
MPHFKILLHKSGQDNSFGEKQGTSNTFQQRRENELDTKKTNEKEKERKKCCKQCGGLGNVAGQ